MEILYDPDDVPRSPELETSKIDYRPKDSPPPFLDVSEPDAKKGADEGTSQDCSRKHQLKPSKPCTTEGNSVLIGYLDQNRPDIAEFEREHPLSENFRPEDGFDSPKKHQLKPAPLMPTDEAPKHPSDLNEKAQSALELLLHKEPSKPDECAPVPASPVAKPSESPSTNNRFKHFTPTDDRDLIKREPDTSQSCQTEIPLNLPTQKNRSPLQRFVIPASEAPAHDLLPALHSPDKNHTLPSLQTALGQTALALPSVSKDPIRPAGSSSFSLPPVTATSPPGLRSELAWEQQRAPKFGPQVHPPSPYSHWSPASTAAGNLSAVSSPASQNWRPLKSEISYLTSHSPYDLHPTAKSPATGYPTPTDQTPGSTCDRTPFNPSTQPNGAAGSTGAFKCSWPGCTAPPFQTQYLLK